MVRDYKKTPGTRQYKNYTQEKLEEAILKVADGRLSMRAASAIFKIPFGTIYNKFNGRHINSHGGQTVFSNAEEMSILKAVAKCADWGFPLNLLELRMFAKSYLDKQGRVISSFVNNLPGRDWAFSLLKRHKGTVTQRISANINKTRATVSGATIGQYFENLANTLQDVTPQNIFNYDETNVSDEPGKVKGIYRRGVKYPEKIANHSKSATTIMICGSADGTLLPPYVIYKSEHLYNTWKENGPKGDPCCNKPCCAQGCRFNRTSHGWMDANTFNDWFESCFLPHAKRLQGKKVLIGDNLASHFNENVIRLCEENDISFVCLVPHSTHICQPLDVGFFKAMKVAWRNILTTYKMKNSRQTGIPKDVFPSLLKDALNKMDSVPPQSGAPWKEKSAIKRNLISAFEATGIYPINSEKVLRKLPDVGDPQQTVDDSLTEFLKEKRYGDVQERVRRKKTRLNIEPGKSVTTNDSNSSSDDEIAEAMEHGESDNSSNLHHDQDDEMITYSEVSTDVLVPGTFVLAKFLSGKRKSVLYKYVCLIKEIFSSDEFTLTGLKSTDPNKKIFRLVEKDVSTISISDIIAILPKPVYDKDTNLYTFDGKVDTYEM